jgi:glycerol-3-phosphate dehydrogenase (NAD(P)+)
MGQAQGSKIERVTVLGAGSWGTALAIHTARRGLPTRLWTRTTAHAQSMQSAGRNDRYLPEHPFPDGLSATSDLDEALSDPQLVICGIPSHGMRAMIERVAADADRHREREPPFYLIAAKGIEVETLQTMHEVLRQVLPDAHAPRIAALGGPSFAAEVAAGLPTTVVVGGTDSAVTQSIQRALSDDVMRAYVTDDVLGVELGGAFKNVIALAAGVGDGAGLGLNARAGLITRGLAEMSRLAISLGAHPATLSGLAGVGDLVLTCTGDLSRNRTLGKAIAAGENPQRYLASRRSVAEGFSTSVAAHDLAHSLGVDAPITEHVYHVLHRGRPLSEAVDLLVSRDFKDELTGIR